MLPCMPSHAVAAAVTEDVSLIAVPANRPNPSLLRPNMAPSVGKIRAASTLKRKMTEIGLSHFFVIRFDHRGAVAAMALPPQIEDPTPTRMALFVRSFSAFIQNKCDAQRGRDRGEDDWERLPSFCKDFCQVHAKSKEYYGCLQDFF